MGGSSKPDILLNVGQTLDGTWGELTIPPSVYGVTIEAGPDERRTLPQFNPLGLAQRVLVGSVLMDQIYIVYEYDVTQTTSGYHLAPVGMWVFNKIVGPDIIQSRSKAPVLFDTAKPVRRV